MRPFAFTAHPRYPDHSPDPRDHEHSDSVALGGALFVSSTLNATGRASYGEFRLAAPKESVPSFAHLLCVESKLATEIHRSVAWSGPGTPEYSFRAPGLRARRRLLMDDFPFTLRAQVLRV